MSVKSYEIIINNLETFISNHLEIKRFKTGYLSKIEQFSNEDRTFPILYCVPVSILNRRYVNIYGFNIYILDKTDNNQDNEISLLNTGQNIMRDLTIWLKESQNELELNNEPILSPLEDYLMDKGFIGWMGYFEITAGTFSSECSIPLNN